MFRKKVDIKSFKKVYLVHNHNAGKQTFFAAMHRSVERLCLLYTSDAADE